LVTYRILSRLPLWLKQSFVYKSADTFPSGVYPERELGDTPQSKAAFRQDTRWLATSVWDTGTQRHNMHTLRLVSGTQALNATTCTLSGSDLVALNHSDGDKKGLSTISSMTLDSVCPV
jgi:hypothetical protein